MGLLECGSHVIELIKAALDCTSLFFCFSFLFSSYVILYFIILYWTVQYNASRFDAGRYSRYNHVGLLAYKGHIVKLIKSIIRIYFSFFSFSFLTFLPLSSSHLALYGITPYNASRLDAGVYSRPSHVGFLACRSHLIELVNSSSKTYFSCTLSLFCSSSFPFFSVCSIVLYCIILY